jgi:hypothetical protein
VLGSNSWRPLDPEHRGKSGGNGTRVPEKRICEGYEHMVKGVINALLSSLGESPGGLFIGVVTGSNNNV